MLVRPFGSFCSPGRRAGGAAGCRRRLAKLALRQQLRLLSIVAQRLFEAAELERLDQVIHHAVVQRLLHRVHIAGGRDDDHIGLLAQFAQAGQQVQPVLLLHVDIQQHQIDADAGVGQQGARLAQSGDRRLAVKPLTWLR